MSSIRDDNISGTLSSSSDVTFYSSWDQCTLFIFIVGKFSVTIVVPFTERRVSDDVTFLSTNCYIGIEAVWYENWGVIILV